MFPLQEAQDHLGYGQFLSSRLSFAFHLLMLEQLLQNEQYGGSIVYA